MQSLAKYADQYFVVVVEVLIAVGVFALMARFPYLGDRRFRSIEKAFSQFASRKTPAILAVFLSVALVRMILLPVIGVPSPTVHDERSYLLMGEMFSHGHLAYPPHPLWMSFETFHINFSPTYSSMFPPAQGAVLAFGFLLGHPWIGVLLSVATMCSAVVWMLQAWMPPAWALLGGVLVVCNLGIISYWTNSYWGGAVAAIGGSLVMGALPRIIRHPRVRYGLVLAIGVAILANSRPYEGMVFCIPAAGWLLFWLFGKASPPLRTTIFSVVVPILVVLSLTATFMAYYNWRLTGNPFLMPHTLNYRTYFRTPVFLWQHARPPIHYDNPQFEIFQNKWVRGLYDNSWRAVLRVSREKIRHIVALFLWPSAFACLLCVPLALRDKRMRLLFIVGFVGFGGLFLVIYSLPHYAAPLTCVIYGLLVQGGRHLRLVQLRRRPAGIGLIRATVLLLLASTIFNVFTLARTGRNLYPGSWNQSAGIDGRKEVERQLERSPGKHLVLVRYSADHNPHGEWVYNHADIDGSQIVWARELDQQQNGKLLAYFWDRNIWLFEPDRDSRTVHLLRRPNPEKIP